MEYYLGEGKNHRAMLWCFTSEKKVPPGVGLADLNGAKTPFSGSARIWPIPNNFNYPTTCSLKQIHLPQCLLIILNTPSVLRISVSLWPPDNQPWTGCCSLHKYAYTLLPPRLHQLPCIKDYTELMLIYTSFHFKQSPPCTFQREKYPKNTKRGS